MIRKLTPSDEDVSSQFDVVPGEGDHNQCVQVQTCNMKVHV